MLQPRSSSKVGKRDMALSNSEAERMQLKNGIKSENHHENSTLHNFKPEVKQFITGSSPQSENGAQPLNYSRDENEPLDVSCDDIGRRHPSISKSIRSSMIRPKNNKNSNR